MPHPFFARDGDVESYLDLEMKVDQFCREIRERRRRHVDTWVDLRRELRSRFVPAFYAKDLYNKLQNMYKGSKSIKEYHRDMQAKQIPLGCRGALPLHHYGFPNASNNANRGSIEEALDLKEDLPKWP
ncbi:hypothetical protein CR513_56325, partial [Mucuna pruriens]